MGLHLRYEAAARRPDAVGFAVHPGRYCEGATFGLAWAPPEDEDGEPQHDAVGDQARTERAIFEHPEFEVLETKAKPES